MTGAEVRQQPAKAGYRHLIKERFAEEIAVFASTYQRSSVYRQLKRATELTAQEYGNRFLVELIQNAHDALPPSSTRGRILVAFDATESAHGVLYVANTGDPFTAERFAAICEFAHSSKRPGESIGNKGIGFRSVLQISDWPEIYSRAGGESDAVGNFDGFCFRFARLADIEAHTTDASLALAVSENVSPYSLPVPIDEYPSFVTECAAMGFATVVRLPLRNAQAAQDASRAFDSCVVSDVPLHLFLGRIARIEFERLNAGTVEYRTTLIRDEVRLNETSADLQLSRVTILLEGSDSPRSDDYLVGAMSVSEEAMRRDIEASIVQGKLPGIWRTWTGEGRVSVGVGLNQSGISRLYNYLPMGETAESPFFGFLDAPFFAKIDRTSLDNGVPLNAALLGHGATTCLRMAELLAATGQSDFGPVVARLLAWSEKELPRLKVAVGAMGSIEDVALIPVLGSETGKQRYASLRQSFGWQSLKETTVIAADRLARSVGVAFLDERVEAPVRARLSAARAMFVGSGLLPDVTLIADWTERLAVSLLQDGAPVEDWDAFYADMGVVFPRDAQPLRGRRIILDDTRTLQRAGRADDVQQRDSSGPLVFFAPVRGRTEGEEEIAEGVNLEIPGPLKEFVRYTHPALAWRTRGSDASIRPFFVQHRLVRRFGTRELRELIRSLLSEEHEETVYAAALEFAFRVISLRARPKTHEPAGMQ